MTSSHLRSADHLPANLERLRVHQAIVDHLDIGPGDVLLDLGCGQGLTLATAASRLAGMSMIGLDLDAPSLRAASASLAGTACGWLQADVGAPLPLRSGSVSCVVCHDVLEYLDDPVCLLVEASRVMRPGALSVWSHTDYAAITIGGADRLLTRRILSAYADASYLGLRRSDAEMGRKVVAAVDRSPLQRTGVDAAVLIATELAGPGRARVDDIARTVARHGDSNAVETTEGDVEEWLAQLATAETERSFFYAQTAFLVTAERPA